MIRRALLVVLPTLIVSVLLWWGQPLLSPHTGGAFARDGRALYAAAMALERSGGFSWDAYGAITCNDTSSRPTPELVEAQARVARKKAPIFGNWAAWSELQCQGWDTVAGDLWLSGPRRPPSPIMIVGTTGDAVVPYAAVTQLRSDFPASALVTYEGGSHTAYGSGVRCVNRAVEAYLADGKVPTAEVVCPAVGAEKP